jgi:surface protein
VQGLFEYFDQGSSFRHLFLHVDCECNQPSFLATVFKSASTFNGDLSRWDVAKVTNMSDSKSIWIVENDLTCRVLTLLCNWRVPSGV